MLAAHPRSPLGHSSRAWRLGIAVLLAVAVIPAAYGALNPDVLGQPAALARDHAATTLEGGIVDPTASKSISKPFIIIAAVEIMAACFVAWSIARRAASTRPVRSLVLFLATVTLAWAFRWFGAPALSLLGVPGLVILTGLPVLMLVASAAFAQFASQFPRQLTETDIVALSVSRRNLAEIRPADVDAATPAPTRFDAWLASWSITTPLDATLLVATVASVAPSFILGMISHATEERSTGSVISMLEAAGESLALALIAFVGVMAVAHVVRSCRGHHLTAWPVLRVLLAIYAILGTFTLVVVNVASARNALALATLIILLLVTWPHDLPRGRRLDWWVAFVVSAFGASVVDQVPLTMIPDLVEPIIMIIMLGSLWLVVARPWDAIRQALRTRGQTLAEPSPPTSRPRRERRNWLRAQLLEPHALWGLVLVVSTICIGAMVIAVAFLPPRMPKPGSDDFSFAQAMLVIPFFVGGLLAFDGSRNLLVGFGMTDETRRRQVVWLVSGALGGLGLFVLFIFVQGLENELRIPFSLHRVRQVLLLSIMPVTVAGVAAAVFYHGAIEPRLILRRTSLFTLFGVLGILTYAVVENVFEGFLAARLNVNREAGPLIAGAVAALSVHRLKTALTSLVTSAMSRWFPAVSLAHADEVMAVVVAIDVADDHAADADAIQMTIRRAELLQRAATDIAPRFDGRVAVVSRDALVLEFSDSRGARDAAESIREEYVRQCGRANVPVTDLRTGIHQGLVLRHANGSLFGQPVDVADQLRREAPPGAILVSTSVAESLGPDARTMKIVTRTI